MRPMHYVFNAVVVLPAHSDRGSRIYGAYNGSFNTGGRLTEGEVKAIVAQSVADSHGAAARDITFTEFTYTELANGHA